MRFRLCLEENKIMTNEDCKNQNCSFFCGTNKGGCKGNKITEYQLEILKLLSEGKPKKHIAKKLFISESTLKTHFKNMFSNTDTHSMHELVAKAFREKWIK